MVGIGMNFAERAIPNANIENTLIFASEVGMIQGDLRVLGILMQWIEVHQSIINADRLIRALQAHSEERVLAYWATIGKWLKKDRRFIRLIKLFEGEPIEILPTGNNFQIKRRGEDERFVNTPLRVPAGTLRRRKSDILSPSEVVCLHSGYRNRVLMGPTWRADVWTALELNPTLSVADAARESYCAFATAWQVKKDFELLQSN